MSSRTQPPAPLKAEDKNLAERYSRFLLSAIVNSCNDAIVSKDLNGTVMTWNAAAFQIFGYTAEEMVGASIRRLIPEELQYEEDIILAKIRSGERIEHYEATRVRKDGRRIQVSLTISPIRDDDGKIIGASKVARDISDRRRVEEMRSRLAAIVDSSDDAIISKDLDGTVTSWNQAATRLYGYSEIEMVGASILKIVPEALHAEEVEILRKLRSGERIDHYETRRLTKSGETVEVSLTISPIKDDEGRIVGASKIARDISMRKRMEQSLIQSEKLAATGRMAATIAHEVNNPLDAVMNLVYLARQSVSPNSKAAPYLATAEKELERVAHIARQTLGFYRDPGHPVEIHIEELLQDVLSVYQSKLMKARIGVDCRFDHARAIKASRGELMQIFSNLITNAVDAMPHGGLLSIRSREVDGGNLEVVVQDSGSGIAPENISKVFEPFFSTKGNLGTGIGLWVTRQLIEKHDGRITIRSGHVAPANGTTVTVLLPFRQP